MYNAKVMEIFKNPKNVGTIKGANGVGKVGNAACGDIMKIYLKGDRPLIHIDAYRLADINSDIGLDEYIGYETGITVIEWPMYLDCLPDNLVEVSIYHLGDDKRQIIFNFKVFW